MAEIKRINILSLLKVVLVISLVFGLIVGIFMTIYISQMASVDNVQLQALAQQSGMSIDQIVSAYQTLASKAWFTITIFSVVCSLISSLIAVLVYNLTAKWWGGLKIDLEEKKK